MTLTVQADFSPDEPTIRGDFKPSLFQRQRVVSATANAFKALSLGGIAATTAVGLKFTASPLVVIGVFSGSAILTVGIIVTAVYLHRMAKSEFWSDPSYRVNYANHVWEQIKARGLSSYTQIAGAFPSAIRKGIITEREIMRAFRPQTVENLETVIGGEHLPVWLADRDRNHLAQRFFELVPAETQQKMGTRWIDAQGSRPAVWINENCPACLKEMKDASGSYILQEKLQTKMHADLEQVEVGELSVQDFYDRNSVDTLVTNLTPDTKRRLVQKWFEENPQVGARQLARKVPHSLQDYNEFGADLNEKMQSRCQADATRFLRGTLSRRDFMLRNHREGLLHDALSADSVTYYGVIEKLVLGNSRTYADTCQQGHLEAKYPDLTPNQYETIRHKKIAKHFGVLCREPSTVALNLFFQQCGTANWPDAFMQTHQRTLQEIFLQHMDQILLDNSPESAARRAAIAIDDQAITARLNLAAEQLTFVAFYYQYGTAGVAHLGDKGKQAQAVKFMDELPAKKLPYSDLSELPFIELDLTHENLAEIVSAEVLTADPAMTIEQFNKKHGQQTFGLLSPEAQRRLQDTFMDGFDFESPWHSFFTQMTNGCNKFGMNILESCVMRWEEIGFERVMATKEERDYFFSQFPDHLEATGWTNWALEGLDLRNISAMMDQHPELFQKGILGWNVPAVRDAITTAVLATDPTQGVDTFWTRPARLEIGETMKAAISARDEERAAAKSERDQTIEDLIRRHRRERQAEEERKQDAVNPIDNEIQAKSASIRGYNGENKAYADECRLLHSDLHNLGLDISRCERERDRLRGEVQRLSTRLERQRALVNGRAHQQQLVQARSEVSESGISMHAMHSEDPDHVQRLLDEKAGEINRLNSSPALAQTPRARRLASINRAIETAATTFATQTKREQERAREEDSLRAEVEAIEAQIPHDEEADESAAAEEALRIEELNLQVATLISKQQTQETGLARATRAAWNNWGLSSQIKQHQQEIADIQQEQTRRADALQKLRDSLQQKRRDLARTEARKEESQRRVSSAKATLVDASAEKAAIEATIESRSDTEFARLEQQRADAQTNLRKVESQRDALQTLHTLLLENQKVASLEHQIDTREQRTASLATTLSAEERRSRQIEERLHMAEGSQAERDSAIAELRNEIRDLEGRKATIEAKAASSIESLNSRLAAAEAEARRICDAALIAAHQRMREALELPSYDDAAKA